MKIKNIGKILAISVVGFTLHSCLDFDVTGAEFTSTTKNEKKVVRQGKVDSINYRVNITEEQYNKLYSKIETNLKTAYGGVYALRGGKNGTAPVVHAYQYLTALHQDSYAQYGVIPHVNYPYSGINLVSSSALDPKSFGGAYGQYQMATKAIVPLLNMEEIDSLPEVKATYLLFYNYACIESVDNYGPMPYQDIKTNKQDHPFTYDNLEVIYNTVEANIDSIVKCYEYYEANRPAWYKAKLCKVLAANTKCCYLAQTDYPNLDVLKRFANSLKLRMAMHIVKVSPETAKKWAEEAVASGVIEDIDQEFAFITSVTGGGNPMVELWNSWSDMRLGAGYEQALRAYNHPCLDMLFEKNDRIANSKNAKLTVEANTKVCGILAGAHVGQEQGSTSNPYNGFSKLNSKAMGNAPLYLMKLSEVCFLRAEGAVRGWNMKGSAKEFYEKGIRAANVLDRRMPHRKLRNKYENAVENYLAIENAIPFTYVDPTGNDADRESQIKVGVKWNEGDSQEIKLEKIITQKYIAGFPNSLEAWVDLRRTGYPRLFNMLNLSDGDGSLKEGDMVRRIPFPGSTDDATLKEINETGLKALNGPDKQATRLWWDVNKPNF